MTYKAIKTLKKLPHWQPAEVRRMIQKQKINAQKRERYQTMKLLHKCVVCGKQDAFTMIGKARCSECAEKHSALGRKSYKINHDKRIIRQHEYVANRIANHICVMCGKKCLNFIHVGFAKNVLIKRKDIPRYIMRNVGLIHEAMTACAVVAEKNQF
jgi:hypothetical protein